MAISLPNKWAPRPYQKELWNYLASGGKTAVIAAHRRFGKDDVSLNHTACAMMERKGSYVHLLPNQEQARKALWTQIDVHTGIRRIDQAFPKELRVRTLENEMFIEMVNGSTWQLAGSDNYNSLVGTGYAGIVYSEFALANPAAYGYLSPIIRESKGWQLFISTPRGHNHFEAMLKTARATEGWYWEVATARDTGVFSEAELQEELVSLQNLYGDAMGRSTWLQEYFVSFDAAIPGAIFAEFVDKLEARGQIGRFEWIPELPVYTGWDLGRADDTVIWFYQVFGGEIRVIDYHASNMKDIPFYARILAGEKEPDDSPHVDSSATEALKERTRRYKYEKHWIPHDARPRTLAAGGKSMLQQFQDCNLAMKGRLGAFAIAKRLDKQEQIQAGRASLRQCSFNRATCEAGIEALRQYQREWDDENKVFKLTPLHNWASHPADAWMTVAVSWRMKRDASGDEVLDIPTPQGHISRYSMGALVKRHLASARRRRSESSL